MDWGVVCPPVTLVSGDEQCSWKKSSQQGHGRKSVVDKEKNVMSSNSWNFSARVKEITLNSITLLAIMGVFWASWKILHISCLPYSSTISVQSCKHDKYLVFNSLYLHTSVPAVQNSPITSGCQEKHQQILKQKTGKCYLNTRGISTPA